MPKVSAVNRKSSANSGRARECWAMLPEGEVESNAVAGLTSPAVSRLVEITHVRSTYW
jgi:hypothetical protein